MRYAHPRRRLHRSPLLALTLAPVFAHSLAAPLDRAIVPATSKVAVHLDVEALAQSQVGKAIMEHKAAFNLEGLNALGLFGIEPFRDFKDITVLLASSPEQAVIVLRATPAIDALWNHLKTEPHAKAMSAEGYDLLSWDDQGTRKYGIVRSKAELRTAYLCNDWEPLVAALKVADGASPAQAPSTGGQAAPSKGSILYFDVRDLPDFLRNSDNDNAQALFGGIRSGAIDLGESSDQLSADASANFDSAQAATDTQQVAQGLAAFGRMAFKSQNQFTTLQNALKELKITADGSRMNISLKWPAADAVAAIQELAKQKENGDDAAEQPKKAKKASKKETAKESKKPA
ncbi:MAG: hypothetical protein K2Y21_04650 [Phycisphaerales bacterium]|nr:hypothetical protein [Phycisphaerales bacterium]